MYRLPLLAAALLVASGCGKGFAESTVVKHADYDTCAQDVYWPAGLFPLVVDQLEPPAPPYEITHIGAQLMQGAGAFDGRDCSLDVGLHVVVWLADSESLDVAVDETDLTFDVEPLAEATLTADPVEGEEFAYVTATVALNPPVLVEESGNLWIGMDAMGDAGSGPGACLGGCAEGGDGIWRTEAPDYEWSGDDPSLALFQLTIAHD